MAKILGVDCGSHRFGFAVSDPDGIVAMPLKMVEVGNAGAAAAATALIAEQEGVESIVVGLPLNMNGTEGPAVQAVREFERRLRDLCALPIVEWDERLTTKTVENVLIEAGVSRQKRKQARDKLAAQVILQSYLDSLAVLEYEPE
ncbi:MAG: Holliday junction resolvase RuvX [Lentisphaerales bacterium]|jgi:putative Holliday junction resolvase|nr:MAG: Holliday junction resolvase RuvX [Lentisphaerales bacterium]